MTTLSDFLKSIFAAYDDNNIAAYKAQLLTGVKLLNLPHDLDLNTIAYHGENLPALVVHHVWKLIGSQDFSFLDAFFYYFSSEIKIPAELIFRLVAVEGSVSKEDRLPLESYQMAANFIDILKINEVMPAHLASALGIEGFFDRFTLPTDQTTLRELFELALLNTKLGMIRKFDALRDQTASYDGVALTIINNIFFDKINNPDQDLANHPFRIQYFVPKFLLENGNTRIVKILFNYLPAAPELVTDIVDPKALLASIITNESKNSFLAITDRKYFINVINLFSKNFSQLNSNDLNMLHAYVNHVDGGKFPEIQQTFFSNLEQLVLYLKKNGKLDLRNAHQNIILTATQLENSRQQTLFINFFAIGCILATTIIIYIALRKTSACKIRDKEKNQVKNKRENKKSTITNKSTKRYVNKKDKPTKITKKKFFQKVKTSKQNNSEKVTITSEEITLYKLKLSSLLKNITEKIKQLRICVDAKKVEVRQTLIDLKKEIEEANSKSLDYLKSMVPKIEERAQSLIEKVDLFHKKSTPSVSIIKKKESSDCTNLNPTEEHAQSPKQQKINKKHSAYYENKMRVASEEKEETEQKESKEAPSPKKSVPVEADTVSLLQSEYGRLLLQQGNSFSLSERLESLILPPAEEKEGTNIERWDNIFHLLEKWGQAYHTILSLHTTSPTSKTKQLRNIFSHPYLGLESTQIFKKTLVDAAFNPIINASLGSISDLFRENPLIYFIKSQYPSQHHNRARLSLFNEQGSKENNDLFIQPLIDSSVKRQATLHRWLIVLEKYNELHPENDRVCAQQTIIMVLSDCLKAYEKAGALDALKTDLNAWRTPRGLTKLEMQAITTIINTISSFRNAFAHADDQQINLKSPMEDLTKLLLDNPSDEPSVIRRP